MSRPKIALVAAVAENGVIGRNNALLWRLRDDMRHFKSLTLDHAVIMGRKTWESLGRPLPQRRNIVITRNSNYGAPGAEVVHSLEEALARCAGDSTAFIIGGAQIYAEALPIADVLYITDVRCAPEGDASFPPIDHGVWQQAQRKAHKANEFNEHDFDFVTLTRR
ncbi:dihydrofolate reductase [Uliginosibacterium sp. H3]|uniref:Dihydrofolate reductase n=1 Tax=Uliginosibacterium silvisoli TaxID=3114758 RepID=A0ABU6K3Y1_9RHOO|nr:dihydrofolate reductase [Uliginosibacterium sp. H3]